MKRLLLAMSTIGGAVLLLATTGSLAPLSAQPGTCYKCTASHTTYGTYSCVPAADGLGHSSCQVIYGQGCILGSICGYYRRRADGTFEESPPRREPRRAKRAVSDSRGSAGVVFRQVASGVIGLGCNGAIVNRKYDQETSQRLVANTRTIRI